MTSIPGHTVLILDGPDCVTGRGAIVPAPPGSPARIMSRIAERFDGDGVLLLTARTPAPPLLELPGWWEVTGKGPWYTVRKEKLRVRVGVLAEISRDNDPLIGADLITTACRHQMWHDLAGIPFYGDGGSTSSVLMDATIEVRGRQVLRRWDSPMAPVVKESPWLGPWDCGSWYGRPVVTLDRNAQFLAAARECLLPLDGLQHTGILPDHSGVGYYLVTVPENPEPRLPHPYGADATPGTEKWVTSVTRDLAGPVRVLDSWTCPRERARRLLDGAGQAGAGKWYERLRDTRAAVIDGQDPDSLALQRAVKDTYSRGVTASLMRKGGRWHRPDWSAILQAKARADCWRALQRAGEKDRMWPVATDTDAVTYAALPPSLKIGSGMGQWKVAG